MRRAARGLLVLAVLCFVSKTGFGGVDMLAGQDRAVGSCAREGAHRRSIEAAPQSVGELGISWDRLGRERGIEGNGWSRYVWGDESQYGYEDMLRDTYRSTLSSGFPRRRNRRALVR